MKTLLPCLALLCLFVSARAAVPVVSNIRAAQIAGTKNVEILYDVSDADGDALTIGVQVSGDAGQTYTIPATALSGHIGAGVAPGSARRIVWNAGADWNGQLVPQARVRVTASDATTPAPPPGMVYIPAGVFQMGDNLDGDTTAMPVHTVLVGAFFVDKYEITREVWLSVQAWGIANGYSVGNGSSAGTSHPMQGITWYDAVRWCNARSEKEGLVPTYYTDDAQTDVYRTGNLDLANTKVKWSANGYRLPTEAEWEKAARGGILGARYPWGNNIVGSQANYLSSGDGNEGLSPATTPVGYYNGFQIPAGTDMANGYGLYDVAGNVWEWCWDWADPSFYGTPAATNPNPRGPATGARRIVRGGSWNNDLGSQRLRISNRTYSHQFPTWGYQNFGFEPGFSVFTIGVRLVRQVP